MIRNQRGLSLVELLAVLAILSFLGTIIWSVFFQGYNFSKRAVTKNMLQQDANLIVTNLTKIHQTSEQYTISTTSSITNAPGCNTIKVSYTNQDNSDHTLSFDKTGFCYSTDVTGTFNPNEDNKINLKITIYDQEDPNNKVEVNAFLYRLK